MLCQAEYEWAQHVVIGKRVGLTEEEIDRITLGPGADGWSDVDRALLMATDELKADAFISDDTWDTLKKTFNDQQMIDLIFAVGNYNLVSMALNTLECSWIRVWKDLKMRLKNKIAIVVGAGQTPGDTIGNGRATAILFAREGQR